MHHPIRATRSRLDTLRRTLAQRLNPAFRGYDPAVDELLYPFDSDGGYPNVPGRAILVRRVQEKISEDLAQLPRTAANRRRIQWLCLTGSWIFASAPEGALEKLRLIMRGAMPAGQLTQAIGRAVSSPQDIELALEFLFRGLEQRSQTVPQWKGAMNHLRATAFILRFRREAGRLLTTEQATMIARAALGVMVNDLRATPHPNLRQRFLSAAMAFLLVLRHRERNQSFLSSPVDGEIRSPQYQRAKNVLSKAQEEISSGRRCHPLVPSAIENALLFLDKRGGDAGIIAVIGKSLEGESNGDDSEEE